MKTETKEEFNFLLPNFRSVIQAQYNFRINYKMQEVSTWLFFVEKVIVWQECEEHLKKLMDVFELRMEGRHAGCCEKLGSFTWNSSQSEYLRASGP